MAAASCVVTADSAKLRALLARISAKAPPEVLDGFLGGLDVPGELVRLESETTAGAIKITLHPTDRLLEFAATVGAG